MNAVPFSRYPGGQLVAKLVVNLVDNNIRKSGKTGHHGHRKQLKRQHG
jgi:hypothetical protein